MGTNEKLKSLIAVAIFALTVGFLSLLKLIKELDFYYADKNKIFILSFILPIFFVFILSVAATFFFYKVPRGKASADLDEITEKKVKLRDFFEKDYREYTESERKYIKNIVLSAIPMIYAIYYIIEYAAKRLK